MLKNAHVSAPLKSGKPRELLEKDPAKIPRLICSAYRVFHLIID